MARPQGPGDDSSMYIVIGGVIAMLVITWFWNTHAPTVYAALIQVARIEAIPFSSFPFMKDFFSEIQELDPSTMDFMQMNDVLDSAGRWYGLFLAPLMVWYLVKGYNMSARERYRRTLNMNTLLQNNGHLYPCIQPILNWGQSLLKEPTDSGPWMVGRQPIQFVAMHGLLRDASSKEPISARKLLGSNHIANPESPVITGDIKAVFDRDAARKVFESQFSPRFQGLDKLPSYLYALTAAFLLFGTDRKDDAQKILDNMSITFRPPEKATRARMTWKPPFYVPGKPGNNRYSMSTHVHVSRREIMKIWKSDAIQYVVRPHNRYRDLVILTLYAYARRKGVIACSEFIWLRPVNRTLYYLLNNYGRRTVWSEVAGPWTHYQMEEVLSNSISGFRGTDLSENDKQVESAVNALEFAMYEEGWIHSLHYESNKERYGIM